MEIAIIGGGISGLALAFALQRRGRDVRVLEGDGRPGGKVATHAKGGYLLEAGPNGFLDNEPATLELVEQLSLTPKLKRAEGSAQRRFLYTRGALREVHASPKLLFSSVLSVSGRLALLAEPLSGRSPEGDESLGSFARRHFGTEAAEVLVDALQSGIYAGDPERLSLASVFPKLKELEREHGSLLFGMLASRGGPRRRASLCSLEGGMETLVAELALRLGASVRRDARVESLARKGEGWTMGLAGGGAVDAAKVVLALPSPGAASLVRPLSADAADALAAIPYAPVAVVHLGFWRSQLKEVPEGFGFLVPHKEGRPILGVLYISSFFPWRAPSGECLVTVMMGGARNPQVLEKDKEALAALAREQLRETLGIVAEPAMVEVVPWAQAIPQYEVGHASRLARAEAGLAAFPGLHLFGNAYRGIGINDCVRNAAALAAAL